MNNGRLEGVIRWSAMNPDLAIISRGTEDYFASFMDLTTPVRPASGDKVSFTPQLVNGRYKARKIAAKPLPQTPIVPSTTRTPSLPKPKAVSSPAAKPVSECQKPALPSMMKCPGCLTLVKPRYLRTRKATFKKQCPKCNAALDNSGEKTRPLGLIAVLLLGVAVLAWMPGGYGF